MELDTETLEALGRIAVASASLEGALLDLLFELTSDDFTAAVESLGTPGVTHAVKALKSLVKESPLAAKSKADILERVRRVLAVVEERNDALHSEWVAVGVQRRGRQRQPRTLVEVTPKNLLNVAERLLSVGSSIRWCWELVVQEFGRLDFSRPTAMPARWPEGTPKPARQELPVAPRRETHVHLSGEGTLGGIGSASTPDEQAE